MIGERHWGRWSAGLDPRSLCVGVHVTRDEWQVNPWPMITIRRSRSLDWTAIAQAGRELLGRTS